MSPDVAAVSVNGVPEGLGQLVLREIEDRDLDVLFEHWTDRDAIRMAAFTSPDQNDRTALSDGGRGWERRVYDEQGRRDRRSSRGSDSGFDLEGHREVTYWIGREDWGRGIATRALHEFLQMEATVRFTVALRATTPRRFAC